MNEMEQTCFEEYGVNITIFSSHAKENSLTKNDFCFMGCIMFELDTVRYDVVLELNDFIYKINYTL